MPKKPEIAPAFGSYEAVKAITGREPPRHQKSLALWEKRGFPPPVMLGTRTKVWNLELVRKFMAKLEAEAAKKKGGRHA